MAENGSVSVKMGELETTTDTTVALVGLGLGSCIGLALVDRRRQVAALAHIVLPEGEGSTKFATVAVPALIDRAVAAGASPSSLEAVLAGGANVLAMIAAGKETIGDRNADAVRAELARRRIRVIREDVGGKVGRTMTVHASGLVTVRAAGSRDEIVLLAPE